MISFQNRKISSCVHIKIAGRRKDETVDPSFLLSEGEPGLKRLGPHWSITKMQSTHFNFVIVGSPDTHKWTRLSTRTQIVKICQAALLLLTKYCHLLSNKRPLSLPSILLAFNQTHVVMPVSFNTPLPTTDLCFRQNSCWVQVRETQLKSYFWLWSEVWKPERCLWSQVWLHPGA